jgi:hypothetical protein
MSKDGKRDVIDKADALLVDSGEEWAAGELEAPGNAEPPLGCTDESLSLAGEEEA